MAAAISRRHHVKAFLSWDFVIPNPVIPNERGTDGDLVMALGEEYATSALEELVKTYNEDFAVFTFNKFDGTPVLVSKGGAFLN